MNVKEFERFWLSLLRNKQFKQADQARRRWNRFVYSKYKQKRLPRMASQEKYEEVVKMEEGRAVAKRSVV